MDGGGVTAPDLAIFTEDGWVVENVGVAARHRGRARPGRRRRGQGPAARPGHRGRRLTSWPRTAAAPARPPFPVAFAEPASARLPSARLVED